MNKNVAVVIKYERLVQSILAQFYLAHSKSIESVKARSTGKHEISTVINNK